MDNDNYLDGYSMDPGVAYGPGYVNVLASAPASESGVYTEAPLDGAKASGEETVSMSRIGVRSFLKSPVGLLVILLPLAYVAFHQVFGNG